MEDASSSPLQSQKKKKRKRIELLLDFVPARDGQSCPFVGYFPSGFDPTQYKIQPHGSQQSGLQVRAYQNMEKYKSRQHQLVVTPSDSNVDFVGTNYLGENAIWQPGNYALGVFNKDSHSLQLIPIAGSKVLKMESRVRGISYDVASISEDIDVEISKDLMLQKKNLLTSTFGTHKSRIRMNRYERGRVKEDALGDKEEIGRLFEKAGGNISVLTNEEALQQANAAIKRNIPPYDIHATTPERAYILHEIITPEEQNCLHDIELLKEVAGKSERVDELRKDRAYPEFVLNRLHKLKTLLDESKNRRAIILSYIRHLLAFYNLPRHVIRSIMDPLSSHLNDGSSKAINLASYANIPDAVAVKLLKLFTSVNQGEASGNEFRVQTTEKRNLLISYILVLGLMIDDFKADPYDLAVELKMSISNLKPHYMELGCKFKAVKEADRGVADLRSAQRLYEVVLPLPLQFPTLRNKPKRKK